MNDLITILEWGVKAFVFGFFGAGGVVAFFNLTPLIHLFH